MNKKIYEIEYLKNTELTEEDLHYLFDTNSLLYSLVIGEFKQAGINKTNEEIIKITHKYNDWTDHYTMSKTNYKKFYDDCIKIMINLYQCGKYEAQQKTEWFLIKYGLRIK